MSFACSQARRLLRAAFTEESLPATKATKLARHLRDCDDCRASYNRLMRLARMWEGNPAGGDGVSVLELNIWQPAVVDSSHAQPRSLRPWTWEGALAAVSAVAVLLVVMPQSEQSAWSSRAGRDSVLSLRLFCATQDVIGSPLVRSLSAVPTPQELAACPQSGVIQFACSVTRPGYVYLFVSRQSQPHWLWPTDPKAHGMLVSPNDGLQAIPTEVAAGEFLLVPTVAAKPPHLRVLWLPRAMSRAELEPLLSDVAALEEMGAVFVDRIVDVGDDTDTMNGQGIRGPTP